MNIRLLVSSYCCVLLAIARFCCYPLLSNWKFLIYFNNYGNHRLSRTILQWLFYRLPKDGLARENWIKSIKSHQLFSADDQKTLSYLVCFKHFDPAKISIKQTCRLSPGAYPTIFPAKNSECLPNVEESVDANTHGSEELSCSPQITETSRQ